MKTGLFGWLAIAVIAAGLCYKGVRWIRADAVADLRREVAAETARVTQEAEAKVAAITAANEQAAAAEAQADAEREQQLAALAVQITELEGRNATCGTVSRATVRALNASR